MIAVLDASAAIEVVLQKKLSDKLIDVIVKADWVISPSLYIAEVNNVFWKYQKFSNLEFEICDRHIEQTIRLVDDFIHDKELYREAFALACQENHSVYDMLYLTLARRNNAVLLSLDKKLITLASYLKIHISL